MRFLLPVVAVLACLVTPGTASAAEGWVAGQCGGWYAIESRSGFALVEWYGGAQPENGTQIVGDFEAFGMKTLVLLPGGREMRVWVEDYWLSLEDARRELLERC